MGFSNIDVTDEAWPPFSSASVICIPAHVSQGLVGAQSLTLWWGSTLLSSILGVPRQLFRTTEQPCLSPVSSGYDFWLKDQCNGSGLHPAWRKLHKLPIMWWVWRRVKKKSLLGKTQRGQCTNGNAVLVRARKRCNPCLLVPPACRYAVTCR